MKILVLQLARLGDIYMTWPFVRALKRQHPAAEIHMMVRSKFESATIGLDELDQVVILPSTEILEPLVNERFDLDAGLSRLEQFMDSLEVEGYQQVYNLTFSPLSSYLTEFLGQCGAECVGYTRHTDGFFNPNDEVSSYFYAQVGSGRSNRVHLVDIFASYLTVPYIESDYSMPNLATQKKLPQKYVVVHIGASEGHKKLSAQHWAKAVQFFVDAQPNTEVILIGAPHERVIADEICENCQSGRIQNWVGDTSVPELFPIIKAAELLIGCDSAPIHIASLTDTPTLNVSLGGVNFWETGPKSSLSYIYKMGERELLTPQLIGETASQILKGIVPEGIIQRAAGLTSYACSEGEAADFAWALTSAIYLGGELPILDNYKTYQAFGDLAEVNNLILQNIQAMNPDSPGERAALIDRGEQILQTISQLSPELSPLVRWVAAEKVRIPPGSFKSVKDRTYSIHASLAAILNNYVPQEEAGSHHGPIQG